MSSKCKPTASESSLKRAGTLITRKSAKAGKFTQPKLNLKKLSADLGKNFPEPIKSVLAVDCVYQILKCKVYKAGKYDAVLLVEVATRDNPKVISTYFTSLYTKDLLKKVEDQGVDLENSPEALEGFTFAYRGERTSSQQYTYSKIDFCTEDPQSDEELEEIDD